jgi:hypothetical protein
VLFFQVIIGADKLCNRKASLLEIHRQFVLSWASEHCEILIWGEAYIIIPCYDIAVSTELSSFIFDPHLRNNPLSTLEFRNFMNVEAATVDKDRRRKKVLINFVPVAIWNLPEL